MPPKTSKRTKQPAPSKDNQRTLTSAFSAPRPSKVGKTNVSKVPSIRMVAPPGQMAAAENNKKKKLAQETMDTTQRSEIKQEPEIKKPVTEEKPEIKKSETKQLPHLDPNNPQYLEALEMASQSTVPSIHQEEYNVVDRLLRKFDLTAEYGPAAGLSRLQRWQRAYALGKHPPAVVKSILETHEGTSQTRYSQPYMYGYV